MTVDDADRSGHRDPEVLLRQVEAAERAAHRGELKIFLGYASGVGKSFRLFDEGRRRHERGEDVIVAGMQPDSPPEVEQAIQALEIIPTREVEGVPVVDVPAVLARRPAVCLIDGLAYDNPPGTRHRKRYEDVEELLEAGISVLTSINLEYIEEQQEFVHGVLGTAKAQTVPQGFIDRADEVVVVDAPPEPDSGIEERQLSQLRQRALLLTADVVDRQLEAYLRLHGLQSSWGTQERILVCMTPRANAAKMLASGRRNADRFHGELFAIYVTQENLTAEDRMALDRNVVLARAQHAQVETLEGKDPIQTILGVRAEPRHHADLRRPQSAPGLAFPSWRHPSRPADPRCRRHRRARVSPVIGGLRKRGRLKVFLGYAAGVGKTYQMLAEAHELKRRGIDVVVGYFEPHGRKETIALSEDLETVPRRIVEYRGSKFEEMDTEGVLRRHPAVAIVDEFPHTNVPGSERLKRWEDVHVLLDAGIDVLTTMNVQHLESLNDQIWQSTGVRVRETIPDWVLKHADEVVMVDLTPRALLNRLARGVIYSPERARAALDNFFKESTLVALRELAMRQAAYAVESRLPGEDPSPSPETASPAQSGRERLLIAIDHDPSSAVLIRRGRRVADYLRAECLAVYVSGAPDSGGLPAEQRENLERNLNFARGLQIETRILQGHDIAETLVSFARLHGVTQILIARGKKTPLRAWFAAALAQRIVNLARDMQVTVVADRSERLVTG